MSNMKNKIYSIKTKLKKFYLSIDPYKYPVGHGEHSWMVICSIEVMSKWKCRKLNLEN